MNKATKSKDRFIAKRSSCMGSLIGYVTASYAELKSVFGTPNGDSDAYKVSTEWEIVDTVTGNSFTLYDYKETKSYSSELPSVRRFRSMASYDWHVGGTKLDMDTFARFLSEKLGRPVGTTNG